MEAFIPLSPLPVKSHRNIGQKCSSRRPKFLAAADKPSKSSDFSDFSGFAAGPGKPRTRATRALGKRRVKPEPIKTDKTAADFVKEGVVDDVDTVDTGFTVEDIRFGIDDVEDPFLRDENAKQEAGTEDAEEGPKDVTGDDGVVKTLLESGEGEIVPAGARVKVSYIGTCDGEEFDRSPEEKPFQFVLGRGEVIKGWEAGIATMKKGERSLLTIQPSYGYGRRGMPPVIPGNAILQFEVVLQEFVGGEEGDIKRVAEFNPSVARTPDEIDAEYRERQKTRAERRKNMSLLERFYIISPFASQTGERPPWWINPNITFAAIALGVMVGFYLVYISGAIHVGYVDQPVDVNIFK